MDKRKKLINKRIDDTTSMIFIDILKFDEEKIKKVFDVINTTVDILNFTEDLPTEELKEIDRKYNAIVEWRSKIKESDDWAITTDPMLIVKARSKVVDLKMRLAKPVAYYKTLTLWWTVNRRATRSATSIAIRQFTKDMDTNIKKLLTVADSDNFGEMLSSQLHLWALSAEYITNYLTGMDNNMKILLEDMTTVINQIKFDMKLWGLANT